MSIIPALYLRTFLYRAFNIIRPFNFDGGTATKLLYSTKKYDYYNLHWQSGIGYQQTLKKGFSLNGIVMYNQFTSFKQYYLPTVLSGYQHKNSQLNYKTLSIGNMLSLLAGVKRNCLNVLVPCKFAGSHQNKME